MPEWGEFYLPEWGESYMPEWGESFIPEWEKYSDNEVKYWHTGLI